MNGVAAEDCLKNGLKRSVAMICICLAFASFAACSRGGGRSSTLKAAISEGPMNLDPRLAVDAQGLKIARMMCDGLFAKDKQMIDVPALVEKYDQLSKTSFRFFIRKDVKFSNGDPLTEEDVVYTYKSILDGTVKSPFLSSLGRIKEIVAEGPLVVRIDLSEPYAPIFTALGVGVISKKAAEAKGDAFALSPVCVGPYKLIKYEPDNIVQLDANAGYFGSIPKIKHVEFQIVKDDNIRVLKLLKGDIDLIQNAVPVPLLEKLQSEEAFSVYSSDSSTMSYLGFNMLDPILKNKEVRQAISFAIDRDEIIKNRWKGLAVKANSILSPGVWAYDKTLPPIEYNIERAKQQLDLAGFPDADGDGPAKRFELVYKTSTNKDRVDIAQLIAYQLEKVGISVRVEPHEWGKFYNDVKDGNFQLYSLSWVGLNEPDMFYDVCHSSQMAPNGLNRSRYDNPAIDKLVEEGRMEQSRDKRSSYYSAVQRILLDDMPFAPMWYEKNIIVYHKGLQNVDAWLDGSYRAWVDFEKR